MVLPRTGRTKRTSSQPLPCSPASIPTGIRLWQPPHFLAEVAAVLAREKPESARDDLADLRLIQWQTVEDAATYESAMDLSIRLGHHLFDTLYHAAALRTPDATLLTADRSYFDKARDEGRIVLLSQFALSP